MNLLIIIVVILLVCAIAIMIASLQVYKKQLDNRKIQDADIENKDIYEKIFNQTPFYYFLIDADINVVLTNYFILNPNAPHSSSSILGNVLGCKNGCDAGLCGTSSFCKSCLIRASLKRAFINKKNFMDLEANMTIYDKRKEPMDIDVSVSGTLFNYKDEEMQLVCIRDITLYKSVQRRLLSLEYKGNFLKRRENIIQRLTNATTEDVLKGEILKLFKYNGDLEERMRSILNAIDIDSNTLLPSIEVLCNDDEQYSKLEEHLNHKYRLIRGKTIEDDILIFLNTDIAAIIITPDIDFQEASRFVDAIRNTTQDVPVIRLLNIGDSIAGNYTKLLYNPVKAKDWDDLLKNLQIEKEMNIK